MISYFGSPTGNTLGLIASSIFLPSIITAFAGDYIAAHYGRKIAVWIGSVIIIAGAILNAAAQNTGQFVGGRILLGSGGAITKVGAPALLHEIAHPRLRGIIGGCYYVSPVSCAVARANITGLLLLWIVHERLADL